MNKLSFDENNQLHGVVFQYYIFTNQMKYYAVFDHGKMLGKATFDEFGNCIIPEEKN